MVKFVPNILEVVPGTMADYRQLTEYHYRTDEIRPYTSIYKVRARAPYRTAFPDPLSVIVYRLPVGELRVRSKATGEFFTKPAHRSTRLKLINQNIRYLCRIITVPQFRRLGIATKLIAETVSLQSVPVVETLTPIDFTNALFQKCGFELFYQSAPPWYGRFTNALCAIGLSNWNDLLPSTLQKRLERLNPEPSEWIENEIKQFLHHFRRKDTMPPGLERTEFALSKIPYPQAYLFWTKDNALSIHDVHKAHEGQSRSG